MRFLRALLIVLMVAGFASATGRQGDALLPSYRPPIAPKGCMVIVTGYNSVSGQTDDTPFLTASQTRTRWGVAAARWLPIGARVQLPEHFGRQVFVVEDRMAPKNGHKMDIWFVYVHQAKRWGRKRTFVRVLEPAEFRCPKM